MKSFPFDSEVTYDSDGNPIYDRGADSGILADFLHLMFSDGVFPNPSTGLQVTASSSEMSVVVKPGSLMIQGRMGIEEVERTIVFNSAGTNYDRIDAVVARLNTNHDYRDIDLYVVKGQEASTPVAPELTRAGGIYELRLANVFIPKETTIITAERITDTRLDTDDCGIVVANPQTVDTAAIFEQYQAALDTYLQYVDECLDGTTAGNLKNQIDEILKEIGSADISEIGDGTIKGAIAAQSSEMTSLKKSVSDGKTAVAAAITDTLGVATESDASFDTMADNIKSIPNLSEETDIDYSSSNTTPVIEGDTALMGTNSDGTKRLAIRYTGVKGIITNNTLFGLPASNFGDAEASQVLSGKYFTSSNGVKASGTMPYQGAQLQYLWTYADLSYWRTRGDIRQYMNEGYHNGEGYIGVAMSAMQGLYDEGYNAGVSAGGSGKYKVASGTVTLGDGAAWNYISIATGLSSVTGFCMGGGTGDPIKGFVFGSWSASGGTVSAQYYASGGSLPAKWIAYGS